MTQALTNVLLIDAVTGCLQNQRSITAASKLAYFDKIRQEGLGSEFVFVFLLFLSDRVILIKEKINKYRRVCSVYAVYICLSCFCLWPVPMIVPKTTSETLKHKINPSLDLAEPQTVHVLLYSPGIIETRGRLLTFTTEYH